MAGPRRSQVRWALVQDRFNLDLHAGDEPSARRHVVRLHHKGVPVRTILEEIFVPAARSVGDAWAAGQIGVAEEHRASEILARLLAELRPRSLGRPRGTAVVGAVHDERHTLPTTMAALALREDRWRVEHLGSDVPADSLRRFVRGNHVDLLVLSVTTIERSQASEEAAQELAAQGVAALVGAPGKTLDELCRRARATLAP